MAKKGIIGTVVEGLTDSTHNIHEINKENMAAVRADSKANHEAATAPDPGMEKFMQAEGLGNKVKVIAENIKEGVRANSEKEAARRVGIQSHSSYKTLLEEQRAKRQTTIKGSND